MTSHTTNGQTSACERSFVHIWHYELLYKTKQNVTYKVLFRKGLLRTRTNIQARIWTWTFRILWGIKDHNRSANAHTTRDSTGILLRAGPEPGLSIRNQCDHRICYQFVRIFNAGKSTRIWTESSVYPGLSCKCCVRSIILPVWIFASMQLWRGMGWWTNCFEKKKIASTLVCLSPIQG